MANFLQKYLQPAFNVLAKFTDLTKIKPVIVIDPSTGEPLNLVTAAGSNFTASATLPTSPNLGDYFWDTTSEILYKYISDGTSNLWLDISSAASSQVDVNKQGFVDYNDSSTSSSPISLSANTWTDIPNDTLGTFTNTSYAPTGLTSIMDPATGYLDFSELTLGSDVLIRIDFVVTPNTNNALLETRYVLGQGAGEYALPVRSRRLDSGSGIPYASEKGSFYIYMGDNNTLGGVGKLQVKLSTTGTLVNNGVAIKIYKR